MFVCSFFVTGGLIQKVGPGGGGGKKGGEKGRRKNEEEEGTGGEEEERREFSVLYMNQLLNQSQSSERTSQTWKSLGWC